MIATGYHLQRGMVDSDGKQALNLPRCCTRGQGGSKFPIGFLLVVAGVARGSVAPIAGRPVEDARRVDVNDTLNGKNLSGLRVMVVDDSKTIRRTAETLLKKVGCEVLTAVDGFEALSKINDLKPQIVFVDVMMPRLDGYQTCALIKNNKEFRSTPVIMLSSKDGLFDKARGRIVGAEQYLTKPFTRDELLGAIRRHGLTS